MFMNIGACSAFIYQIQKSIEINIEDWRVNNKKVRKYGLMKVPVLGPDLAKRSNIVGQTFRNVLKATFDRFATS